MITDDVTVVFTPLFYVFSVERVQKLVYLSFVNVKLQCSHELIFVRLFWNDFFLFLQLIAQHFTANAIKCVGFELMIWICLATIGRLFHLYYSICLFLFAHALRDDGLASAKLTHKIL